jgi:hypothetical protein
LLDSMNSDYGKNFWCQLGDRLAINPLIWPEFMKLATTQNYLYGRLHHCRGSVITGDLEVNPQFVLVCSLHPQPSQTQQHPAHICKYFAPRPPIPLHGIHSSRWHSSYPSKWCPFISCRWPLWGLSHFSVSTASNLCMQGAAGTDLTRTRWTRFLCFPVSHPATLT